jgi:hypothetical protein
LTDSAPIMFFIGENPDITKNLHAGSVNEVDAMDEQHALEVRFAHFFHLNDLQEECTARRVKEPKDLSPELPVRACFSGC